MRWRLDPSDECNCWYELTARSSDLRLVLKMQMKFLAVHKGPLPLPQPRRAYQSESPTRNPRDGRLLAKLKLHNVYQALARSQKAQLTRAPSAESGEVGDVQMTRGPAHPRLPSRPTSDVHPRLRP